MSRESFTEGEENTHGIWWGKKATPQAGGTLHGTMGRARASLESEPIAEMAGGDSVLLS